MPHLAYLGLGCNLGDRHKTMAEAVRQINERIGTVCRQSALIETEPWGFESENLFLNGCVSVETTLEPLALLAETQAIERDMGRTHKSVDGHYVDRTIDIDILLYDDLHFSSPELQIPHPHIAERDFVLRPLREILPAEQLRQLREILPTKKQRE